MHLRPAHDRRELPEAMAVGGVLTGRATRRHCLARDIELFYGAGKEPGGVGWRAFGIKAEGPVFEENL